MYYKISDQQELVWSYDGVEADAAGHAKVAPIAFYKATNYETDFYALSDTAAVNKMKSNIDYPGEAWPCELERTKIKDDKTFTQHGDVLWGAYPQDSGTYEFQDGNLQCEGDYTVEGSKISFSDKNLTTKILKISSARDNFAQTI